eukprot:gene1125-1286_t
MLAVSAGLLFSVATLELLPEGIEIAMKDIDDTEIAASSAGGGHHDHEEGLLNAIKERSRTPMYGIAFGFALLIAVEALLSGDKHNESMDSISETQMQMKLQ